MEQSLGTFLSIDLLTVHPPSHIKVFNLECMYLLSNFHCTERCDISKINYLNVCVLLVSYIIITGGVLLYIFICEMWGREGNQYEQVNKITSQFFQLAAVSQCVPSPDLKSFLFLQAVYCKLYTFLTLHVEFIQTNKMFLLQQCC